LVFFKQGIADFSWKAIKKSEFIDSFNKIKEVLIKFQPKDEL
jgi:hypothetical protein